MCFVTTLTQVDPYISCGCVHDCLDCFVLFHMDAVQPIANSAYSRLSILGACDREVVTIGVLNHTSYMSVFE